MLSQTTKTEKKIDWTHLWQQCLVWIIRLQVVHCRPLVSHSHHLRRSPQTKSSQSFTTVMFSNARNAALSNQTPTQNKVTFTSKRNRVTWNSTLHMKRSQLFAQLFNLYLPTFPPTGCFFQTSTFGPRALALQRVRVHPWAQAETKISPWSGSEVTHLNHWTNRNWTEQIDTKNHPL